MQRKICKIIVALACALLTSCALKPKYLAQGYAPPQKIAVLPMSNQSNDLKGPEVVRKEFVAKVQMKGYAVQPTQETDEILRTKLGINEGGQLASVTPQEVGAALNVDAIVYGDLINFKFVNIGFYQNKLVEADFKMVDTKSGQPLWEDRRKSFSIPRVETNPKEAAKAFGRGVAEKAVENMLEIPLYEQVQDCVRWITATLPVAR